MAQTAERTGERESHDLRRHVGQVGLLFASVGSIIGSGWLFGALNAARTAGPAAVFSWALGGLMILAIGLCYAELGTMFPLSGGVVRFPHISFGSFASFTTGWFITSATVLSSGSGPLVLAAMRRQIPEQERPFRLPGGHVIPFLGFWSWNLIVYWTGWDTDYKLFLSVLLGFVLLAVMVQFGHGHRTDRWHWRAGSWYLPWLAGLALLSWLGDYGGGLEALHFDSAIPVTFVFSALIYWMAHSVRLDPAEVERHIDESRREASVEEEALGHLTAG